MSYTLNANEAKRRAELEEIRTAETSNIIDEAISSGKTAEEVAYTIVKSQSDVVKAVDQIADAINNHGKRIGG